MPRLLSSVATLAALASVANAAISPALINSAPGECELHAGNDLHHDAAYTLNAGCCSLWHSPCVLACLLACSLHILLRAVLYVWTGDYDKQQPDFLAVFEFNNTSPDYGKLVKKVNIPTKGNEPHHGQFSYDGYRFGAAGILSFLYPIKANQPAQPQLYFFDTTDPRNPRFANSEKSALSLLGIPLRPDALALDFGTADEFYPLPDNTFL
eukprot:3853-Heterococcus_DN1.PRE.1